MPASGPGECLLWRGCLLLGDMPASGPGVSALGGVYSYVVSALRGCVSAPRGVCSEGCLPLLPGVLIQHAMGQIPPVNRMTDRCKNITLPQTSLAGGKR